MIMIIIIIMIMMIGDAREAPGEERDAEGAAAAAATAATAAERSCVAFLFLNAPAWVVERGGALRCELAGHSRDVWGDGGRLALVRGDIAHSMLPCSCPHTVLMARLHGVSPQKGSKGEEVSIRRPRASQLEPIVETAAPAAATAGPEATESMVAAAMAPAEVPLAVEAAGAAAGAAGAGPEADGSGEAAEAAEEAEAQPPPPPLILESREAVKLFEDSFSSCFVLD